MSILQSFMANKSLHPPYQALLCFVAALVFTLVGKLAQWTNLLEVPARFPWMTSASFLLLFAMFNSVSSLAVDNMMKYWGRSIYSFLGLAVASGLVAYLFSSLSISEAGSFRWIYFVLTFGYLVFLSIVTFMRRIVEFAQKEEWNHPRIRRKR
jgi:drug/metabolite transporter (DMT)-like permease